MAAPLGARAIALIDRMNRRDTLFTLLALAAVVPFHGRAQGARRYRIAVLGFGTDSAAEPYKQALRAGLQDFGYAIGRNLELHERFANGDASRLPALVDELIALKPDVLVAGSELPARAMKAKTAMLPIVVMTSSDLVTAGLVQSLARPGTNVTGLTIVTGASLLPKRLELLLETAPRISRLAHLLEDADAASRGTYEPAARTAAEAKGLKISAVFLRDREDAARAFAEIERLRPDGLIIGAGGLLGSIRREIALEARRLGLPAISGLSTFVDDGLLMSYGWSAVAAFRYGVKYIDRILKGARPAELPVEQAQTFEFVVNRKTAREIGITIPQSILLRADRVIE